MKNKEVDLGVKPQEAFYRLRSNSADWTGYNSVVVEDAVNTGLRLAERNAYLEGKFLKDSLSETKIMVSKVFSSLGWIAGLAAFVFVIYTVVNLDIYKKDGFLMGIQLSESIRTGTPVENIRVESNTGLPSKFYNGYTEPYWNGVTIFIDKKEQKK